MPGEKLQAAATLIDRIAALLEKILSYWLVFVAGEKRAEGKATEQALDAAKQAKAIRDRVDAMPDDEFERVRANLAGSTGNAVPADDTPGDNGNQHKG